MKKLKVTKRSPFDLSITGNWGLYTCLVRTKRGFRWVDKRVEVDRIGWTASEGRHAFYIEGGDRCRDIVAAAVKARLRVEVNGADMKGFKAT